MKKFFLALALVGLTVNLMAGNASVQLKPSGFTNLLSFAGIANVTQFTVAANNGTNAFVLFVDCPTNLLTYTTPAYTQTVSYVTNLSYLYTNYFGVSTTNGTGGGLFSGITNTYTALVDVPQTVAAATNAYPIRFGLGALSGSTASVTERATFLRGIWVTNASSGDALVSIVYQQ